jgi:hypothetical protein
MSPDDPPTKSARPAPGRAGWWLLAGIAGGMLGGLLLVAATVAATDPLLFFRQSAVATQPFFYLAREGNFSRYVYTGLVRNLHYEVLWVGPSYVAPFGRGADPRRELVVSMGNMSGWEMRRILRRERLEGKAKVINVLISAPHLTDEFAPGWNQDIFPDDLWGSGGTWRYLLDPYMLRLAGRYLVPAGPRMVDLESTAVRTRINEGYFWMYDDPTALRDYWKQYKAKSIATQDLNQARRNIRQLLEEGGGPVSLTAREEQLLADLFAELRGLASRAKVNLIFPPRHISAFGTDYAKFRRCGEVKRRIVEQAAQGGVTVFDFQGEESIGLDRTRLYDSQHFTERGVHEMREEILGGVPRERSLPALFAKFLATNEDDDRRMLAEIPD